MATKKKSTAKQKTVPQRVLFNGDVRCKAHFRIIDLLSKVLVATHETGHAVAAAALGGDGVGKLIKRRRQYTHEPLWRGVVHHYTDHSAQNLATITVAGPLAELRMREPQMGISELADCFINELCDCPQGWDGDRTMLPTDGTELINATLSAARILNKHRKAFDWTVAELIVHECVGVDDIAARLEPPRKPKRKQADVAKRRAK